MKTDYLLFTVAVIILIFTAAACDDSTDSLTPIKSVDITVIAPSPGRFPDDTTVDGAGHFSLVSASWTPGDHTFVVYKAYTVYVTLAANKGCFFADNLSAAINGQNAEVTGGGSTVTLSYQFAEIPDSENEGMNGTPEKPFKVYDVGTLRRVGTEPSGGWSLVADYEQIADIVLPPVSAGESNWTAIGSYSDSANNSFKGIYDGGGYSIFNLTINTNTGEQGMFSYITKSGDGGIVQNVCIINGSIRGSISGGIAGRNEFGTIQNCYFNGSVTGSSNTGGIVGDNLGTVQNCYSEGSVSGGYSGIAGGVVGNNGFSTSNSGTVQNCYSTARISSFFIVGGVVGENNSGGTVQNCVALNLGATTSSDINSVGRVVGENNGTLANNYAHSNMVLEYNWDGRDGENKTPVSSAGGVDGASIGAEWYNSKSWWRNAGIWKTDGGAFAWDFAAVWKWDSAAGLPVLKK